MHPTPSFRWTDRDAMLAFVGDRAFATIVASIDGRLAVAQAPVLVDDARLHFHLSRRNPVARAERATAIVHGPDAYVSPDWYGQADQVPTWSYISVELDGSLGPLPDATLADLLHRQAARFEAGLAGKPPWSPAQMTPSVFASLREQIVGLEMSIEDVRGTRKHSQNKPPEARAGVLAALDASTREGDRALAAWMRRP